MLENYKEKILGISKTLLYYSKSDRNDLLHTSYSIQFVYKILVQKVHYFLGYNIEFSVFYSLFFYKKKNAITFRTLKKYEMDECRKQY